MNIDTLYSLERASWRYPGMSFPQVLDQSVITTEDEEGNPKVVMNLAAENVSALRWEGPEFEDMGRPAVIIPIAHDMLDGGDIGFIADLAAENLEENVKRYVSKS